MSSLCCHQLEEQVTNREPRVVLILHEITRLKQTTAALKKKKNTFTVFSSKYDFMCDLIRVKIGMHLVSNLVCL